MIKFKGKGNQSMSLDLQNISPNDQGMGGLAQSRDALSGAIKGWTDQVNQGRKPEFGGGGEYNMGLEPETDTAAKSKFVSSQMTMAGQPSGGFPETGYRVSSMSHHLNDKAPVDPLFGQKYSRKQYLENTKREAREISFIANKNRRPPPKRDEETFRAADSIFESTQLSGQRLNPLDYALNMRFLKMTPEMMINLGIIPQSIKSNLDQVQIKLINPDARQIVNSARNAENETAQRMFDNASGQMQEQIAAALDTKKKDGAKMFKPPSIRMPAELQDGANRIH